MSRRRLPPAGWPRSRKAALYGFIAFLLLFVAATVKLFLMPARDAPRKVDAVVVLGGDGSRLTKGLQLIQQGYAKTLVVSVPAEPCPAPIKGIRLICFEPHPFTTQGEAREIKALVAKNGWKSVMVVSTTAQDTRARIRIKRCTDVDVAYVTTASSSGPRLVFDVVYEWAALGKALIFQRGC